MQSLEETEKTQRYKVVTTKRIRNYLMSEPIYYTTKFFTENLLAIEKKKTEILMNKPVHLGLWILELSKILMHKLHYDYVKSKYSEKAKLCYMDTDSFIVDIKTDYINKYIAEDVEARFDTSNYELDRPLPKGENKKVIGLMKDEISEKIMTKFVELTAKIYIYLIDDGSEDKKAKEQNILSLKENLNLRIIKPL